MPDNKKSKKTIPDKKEKPKQGLQNINPEEILETEDIPEEQKKILRKSMQISSFSGPSNLFGMSQLIEKFNDRHINQIIKNMDDDSKRYAKDQIHKRRFSLTVLIICIATFFGICFIFQSNQELIFRTIEIVVLVAGSGFGGYGLAKRSTN